MEQRSFCCFMCAKMEFPNGEKKNRCVRGNFLECYRGEKESYFRALSFDSNRITTVRIWYTNEILYEYTKHIFSLTDFAYTVFV